MDQGKPTLEGMPLEIQVEILRNLLRRDYPIKLCHLDSESDQDWGFGSLGILRTSRHLSDVSLGILYGENAFKLLKKVHLVLRDSDLEPSNDKDESDSELEPSNDDLYSLRGELEHSRWSILKDMPRDIKSYASSLDCLDLISQTSPGQERLRSVSVEMSYHMIILFMEGLLPQILKRLRALQSLELTVKRKAWTWQSYCSCTTEAQGSHLFDREFLLLIKRELGHIKTITMTDYGKADNEGEGLCPWILEQLEKRNRAWTPQLAGGNRFVRTTCAMTTLNPVVFSSIGEIEYGWRRERGPYGVRHKKITPIPDVPRDVFH